MSTIFDQKLSTDTQLHSILQKEFDRQKHSIELIASENYTSSAVLESLGSILTNKYSEGYPGKRYYGGNQHIDEIESLCQQRAITAFHLDKDKWHVNVQPYSGSPANLATLTGLLKPHDRIMGLNLPSGGHLTHGFYTPRKKISATSIFFESFSYDLDPATEMIDYDKLEELAIRYCPQLIICGYSGYSRDLDYERFRQIADKVNAFLMCDMAHFSGLVAAREISNPFDYCDIVTSTTHKTLRGPRSGIIFVNKDVKDKDGVPVYLKIDDAVFPGCQGGPHNHQIMALAYQLGQVVQPEFKEYIQKVKANAQSLANCLISMGFHVLTGGTDNHIVMVNVKKTHDVTGSKLEKLLEEIGISINKNACIGDTSPLSPSGIRLGTSCMTTRGFTEDDFSRTASYIKFGTDCCLEIQNKYGKKLTNFNTGLKQILEIHQNMDVEKEENKEENTEDFDWTGLDNCRRLGDIKREIYQWTGTFPFYSEGFDD